MSTEWDWDTLRRRLQSLMHEVDEEIRSYPAPIPACDSQFNHLLELRRLLPQELCVPGRSGLDLIQDQVQGA